MQLSLKIVFPGETMEMTESLICYDRLFPDLEPNSVKFRLFNLAPICSVILEKPLPIPDPISPRNTVNY